MNYITPTIEFEEISVSDVIASSATGGGTTGENETPIRPGQGYSLKSGGSIAGGSTVSSIVGSGDANTFSIGDVLGH